MLTSLTRTLVPLVVAYVVTQFPAVDVEAFTELVTVLIAGGYYVIARALEHYVAPGFGWLLGSPTEPNYDEPAGA